jgi:archaellum biogenesis protein FlaJ (TadC family)
MSLRTSKRDPAPSQEVGLQASLDEMRTELQRQFEGMDKLKDLARAILGSGSMIVAFAGVLLQVPTRMTAGFSERFAISASLVVILYVALIVACVVVIMPAGMSGPIAPNEKELEKAYFNKNKPDVLKKQLANTLHAISLNEAPLRHRKRWVTAASFLLPLVVLAILLAALTP